jgi:hypothetical protein
MLKDLLIVALVGKDPDLVHTVVNRETVFVFCDVDDPENRHV